MNRVLLYKSLITAFLILIILIPLHFISNTVQDRETYRESAINSILASHAGEQTITGPILVVPYTEVTEKIESTNFNLPAQTSRRTSQKQLLVFPKTLTVKGEVAPGVRYRGIHKVLVYELQSRWQGTFALPDTSKLAQSEGHVSFTLGKPYIALGISDIRGLLAAPTFELGGKPMSFEEGARLGALQQGLHADVDLSAASGNTGVGERLTSFTLTLPLAGAQSLAFAPIADQNEFSLASPWPHPSFSGAFLPRSRKVSEHGFSGEWSITSYNTKVRSEIASNVQAGSDDSAPRAGGVPLEAASVELIEPVDVYTQTERAVKYGGLFVLLTFAGFFMFELIKRLRIHPIQYLLVGFALALFFLLLLSLSEHIAFGAAYLIASAACIGLLGFYLSFVLQSWQRGLGFAMLLSGLYAALYGLLLSEDNALMLGSLLLFAVLSAIMALTRRIDWYALGAAWQPLRDKAAERTENEAVAED
jgi:inner membrane protein